MNSVTLTINGMTVTAPAGSTILEAARSSGIYIPTLCYHPDLTPEGACRLCICEVSGAKGLVASCCYPVAEGMVVQTNTNKVRNARRMVMELLLANHPKDCLSCQKNGDCELQDMAAHLGVRTRRFDGGAMKAHTVDDSNPCLVRDQDKCILCGRCIRMCRDVQHMNVYSYARRGFDAMVAPAFEQDLSLVACAYCGQCASVCPTAAIREKDDTERVWEAIHDPEKIVVCQVAPSVRVSLGEEMGMEPGSIVTGKMVAALKSMGFDRVFDTDFSADLTIMEEGYEFLHRLRQQKTLPMITSCSPGWVNMCEMKYPDLLDHLSTAKSPQGMFGTVIKTYWAEMAHVAPANIVSVSIMPCTAKKAECLRPQLRASGWQDVDISITTRELGRMLREDGIDFTSLPEQSFDDPLGSGSSAGVIFGTSGGVMEAALRTIADVVSGEELKTLEYTAVRGLYQTKEATLQIAGRKVRVAVCNSLGAAQTMMDRVRAGTADYDFIEIMACPGGCIGGGGQPVPTSMAIKKKRMEALYRIDDSSRLRKSHDNPQIQTLYRDWLGAPLSEKARQLLHTRYAAQHRM